MSEPKFEFARARHLAKKQDFLARCLERRDLDTLRRSTWFSEEWLELLIDYADYQWSIRPSKKAKAIVKHFFKLDEEGSVFLKEHYRQVKRSGGYACPPTHRQLVLLAKISAFKLSRKPTA